MVVSVSLISTEFLAATQHTSQKRTPFALSNLVFELSKSFTMNVDVKRRYWVCIIEKIENQAAFVRNQIQKKKLLLNRPTRAKRIVAHIESHLQIESYGNNNEKKNQRLTCNEMNIFKFWFDFVVSVACVGANETGIEFNRRRAIPHFVMSGNANDGY